MAKGYGIDTVGGFQGKDLNKEEGFGNVRYTLATKGELKQMLCGVKRLKIEMPRRRSGGKFRSLESCPIVEQNSMTTGFITKKRY